MARTLKRFLKVVYTAASICYSAVPAAVVPDLIRPYPARAELPTQSGRCSSWPVFGRLSEPGRHSAADADRLRAESGSAAMSKQHTDGDGRFCALARPGAVRVAVERVR